MEDQVQDNMKPEFKSHLLNQVGLGKASFIGYSFSKLLSDLEMHCTSGREFSIVKTKLEEACFFAKKAMAVNEENQTYE